MAVQLEKGQCMSAYTDVRSELIQIIGYQGETCLPGEKPVTAFFTDRYLNPVLDGLVKYIEEIRVDERERIAQEAWAEATAIVLTHRDMARYPSDAWGRLDRLLHAVASRHDAIARGDT
jgi:hypothetical protein